MKKPHGPGRVVTEGVTYSVPPVNFKETSIPPTREKKTSGIEAIINTPKSKMPINA